MLPKMFYVCIVLSILMVGLLYVYSAASGVSA